MTMLRSLLSVAVVAAALTARADEPKKDAPKAADLPIKAKLIAKKDTYTLDLGGKSVEEFNQALKDAEKTGKYPPAPAVELTLELTNTSDKDVKLWVEGDPNQVMLTLKGPDAVTVAKKAAFTADFRGPKTMTLAPGKSYTVAVNSLQFGFRGASQAAYWLKPGEYTLSASYSTAISPAPKDSKEAGEPGFGLATVTSEPIKIKVEAK
jgi:hypothetical protein